MLKRRPAGQSSEDRATVTREKLLAAARCEFSRKGLAGARVDEIAVQAGVNKQLVYRYFSDKRGLYLAVVERICEEIADRGHMADIEELPPERALRRLIEALFDYLEANVGTIDLLSGAAGDEQYGQAAFSLMLSSPARMTAEILQEGQRAGTFRKGIDPAHLFISVIGICHFFFASTPTLSAFLGKDFSSRSEKRDRREHVAEFVLQSLRP